MLHKKNKLVTIIRILFIGFMVSSVISILVLQIYQYKKNSNESSIKMRKDYVENQKQNIKNEVNRVIEYINFQKSLSNEKVKEIVKEQVNEAFQIAEFLFKKNQGKKDINEIKNLILDSIRPMRYKNGDGYFFITELSGIEILFADKPEMEGKNLLNLKDSHGNYVIKDMINIVKNSNEGFYTYYWTKPNVNGNNHKKISYVKYFKPFNWFIGTGLYVEDVEQNIKIKLINEISKIRFGKEGYIFVNRINGETLVSNGKVYSGDRKFWEIFEKPKKMRELFQLQLNGIENIDGDFIKYKWHKLTNISTDSEKISFVKKVKGFNWIVGAGLYTDDIELEISKLQNTLRKGLFKQIVITLVVTVFIFLFFMILFDIASKYILNDFSLFVSFFDKAAIVSEKIDLEKIKYEELYTLADSANKMLSEKNKAENELLAEKEQLSESRLKYKTLFESAGNALFLIKNGVFIDCNSKTLEMFRTKKESIMNKSPVFYSPEIQPDGQESSVKADDLLKKVISGENQHFEWKHKRADGELFDAAVSLSFADLSTGPHVLAIVADISEKKRVENELLKLRKLDSIGVLAGGIAHDFNNLLTGVYGNLEIAKLNIDKNERAYRFLQLAEISMDNAKNLTKQLLTFSKGGDPIKERISIVKVIKDTAEFSLRGSKSIVKFNFDENVYLIEADKGQISQVISNLVINANQAMVSGGTIKISVKNHICDKRLCVVISIKDEGHGIDEENLDKIFDPYFSTKEDGNGLGLATTYSIVNKHNGKIEVNSEKGKGTEFNIFLPAIMEKDSFIDNNIENNEDENSQLVISEKNFSVKTVLVLEDEEIVRDVIKEMLEMLNVNVSLTVEGKEAVSLYKRKLEEGNPFDLVITDLTIPGGMGGLDATKEILKLNKNASVIVSSGYATNPIMANYSKYGFKNRIEKPYRFKELQDVLSNTFKNCN